MLGIKAPEVMELHVVLISLCHVQVLLIPSADLHQEPSYVKRTLFCCLVNPWIFRFHEKLGTVFYFLVRGDREFLFSFL